MIRILPVLAILPVGGVLHRRAADSGPRPPRGELPRIVPLRLGLVIGEGPPEGWDRLVIKSVPRLTSGDLASLPDSARSTATLFRTVILADARGAANSPFALDRIGLGLCVSRDGKDVVVSPGVDPASIGVRLGPIEKLVLDRASKELAKARLVARTPTFAILDAPTTFSRGGEQRDELVRYAFLVDRAAGSILVAVWALASDPSGRAVVDSVVVLSPSLVAESPIDVSSTKLLGRIPVSWSFALSSLPPGRKVSLPADIGLPASRVSSTPSDAEALESGLRSALSADRKAR